MKTPDFPSCFDALLGGTETPTAARLDQFAADWPADPAWLLGLADFTAQADPGPQTAATGLLKRYLDAGATLPGPAAARLLDLLPAAGSWQARLHLLQMLPRLPVPPERAADLLADTERLLAGERNRFVRAWAFGGLHHLAALHTAHRPAVRARLARAAQEEAPSVKARLRRLPEWE